MININNVTKFYNTTPALQNVCFTVPSQSITALVGLNGAGKTTLLKAIAGIHYPDSGTIMVNNFDTVENLINNKNQIGFVGEQDFSISDFTVFDYLDYGMGVFFPQYKKDERYRSMYNIISACSLDDVLFSKVKTLSKGYKQRVNFAHALLHKPSVLLLDEPTSGLDPQQIVEMRSLIQRLSKDKTILISTHLMQEIEALCSDIAILHKGQLCAFGRKNEICEQTQCNSLEKAFLLVVENHTNEDAL